MIARRAFLGKIAATATAAILAACGDGKKLATSSPTKDSVAASAMSASLAPTATVPVTPANSIALGTYVDSVPEYPRVLDRFIAQTGKKPALLMWYRNWANGPNPAFTAADLDVAYNHGAMPMITWQPLDGAVSSERRDQQPAYRCANIAAGHFDAFIIAWAKAAAAYQKVFYLRFAHEMNGNWYPWGTTSDNANGNTPAEYVAMWRHVVDIFRQQGATNVYWVWSPNASYADSTFTPFAQVYPGDGYVDWVGIDGYNFGTTQKKTTWTDLTSLMGETYDALVEFTNKPMMFAEIASAEQGGDKAAWITQGLMTDIPARFPRVYAVVWFNANREANWRVDSSPTSLAAYANVAKSALYSGLLSESLAPVVARSAGSPRPFATPAFQQLWNKTDASPSRRIYVWGPGAFTDGLTESYDSDVRTVQYFDKGRMELTNGTMTTGLLTVELITGNQQTGDATSVQRGPARIPAVGDPDNVFPTYADLAKVQMAEPNHTVAGMRITKLYRPDGSIGTFDVKGDPLTVTQGYDDATKHNLPKVFHDFRSASEFGGLAAIGLAVTEPVWVEVSVAGREVPVLVQGFQRRVLTYTPDNPVGFRVEYGNIGRAYYQWRYGTSAAI